MNNALSKYVNGQKHWKHFLKKMLVRGKQHDLYFMNIYSYLDISTDQVVNWVQDQFTKNGLTVGIQPLNMDTSSGILHYTVGSINASQFAVPLVNVYGVGAAPRADHTEALVLAAPWISKTGRRKLYHILY
jgi:hypothetical protein